MALRSIRIKDLSCNCLWIIGKKFGLQLKNCVVFGARVVKCKEKIDCLQNISCGIGFVNVRALFAEPEKTGSSYHCNMQYMHCIHNVVGCVLQLL